MAIEVIEARARHHRPGPRPARLLPPRHSALRRHGPLRARAPPTCSSATTRARPGSNASSWGPSSSSRRDATVAVAGAELPPKVDGVEQPRPGPSFAVKAGRGAVLRLPASAARAPISRYPAASTCRWCSAAARPIRSARSAASRAAALKARRRAAGRAPRPAPAKAGRDPAGAAPRRSASRAELRVLPGLYWHRITEAAGSDFFADTWKVAPEADRIGYRFRGGRPLQFVPRKQPFGAGSDPSNIVDSCYPYGSIQVPGGTEPIVLHRDAVSGGGYFMIGTVISADMDLIGQLQPHSRRALRRGRHGRRAEGAGRAHGLARSDQGDLAIAGRRRPFEKHHSTQTESKQGNTHETLRIMHFSQASRPRLVAPGAQPPTGSPTRPSGRTALRCRRQVRRCRLCAARKATKPWKICVSFPHMKDAYWLGVDYGVVEEAKRLGVKMNLVEAGGYTELNKQISQIEDCVANGAKAVVIGAISSDGLNNLVTEICREEDSGHRRDQRHLLARRLGEVAGVLLHDGRTRPANTWPRSIRPGRRRSRSAGSPGRPAPAGSRPRTRASSTRSRARRSRCWTPKYGDTGKEVQSKLVEDALQANPDIELHRRHRGDCRSRDRPSCASAASGQDRAPRLLYDAGRLRGDRARLHPRPRRPTRWSSRAASRSTRPSRILEGKDFVKHVGPKIFVVDKSNLKTVPHDNILPPDGFKAVFKVN